MKNIFFATFAACILTFGSLSAQAQWTNCSGSTAGNDCLGYSVLGSNSGGSNAVFGNYSMHSNTTGTGNAALGQNALYSNTTGVANTAAGYQALYSETSGYWNTAVGIEALRSVTTGSDNVGIGYGAGFNITTGSTNIAIGSQGSSSDNGVIRIGGSSGYGANGFYAAGIFGTTVSSGDAVEVVIGSDGQLGTVNSSIRFKKDVHEMGTVSDRLFQLRPVTYHYKQAYANGSEPIEYGLIAEEVAKVYPDLVVKNTDGQIQTVQYQKLTPMMLNELQKQHQLLEEQKAKIAQLEEQLAALPSLQRRLTALEATRPLSSGLLEARLTTK
jgi:hypothetical protein